MRHNVEVLARTLGIPFADAHRQIMWLDRFHNEWNLTPADGPTLRQYAMDRDHGIALTQYRVCEPEAFRDHVCRMAAAVAGAFVDLHTVTVATDPFSRVV